MATLSVGGTTVFDGSATQGLTSGTTFPTGHVLQVVQTIKSDTFSVQGSANVWADITGFSATITPASTSNKVLVWVTGSMACGHNAEHIALQVVRGSSTVVGGHTSLGSHSPALTAHQTIAASNNAEATAGHFLDSPSTTSATTYKIKCYSGGQIFYLNRATTDTDNAHYMRGVSTLTLMEIKV